MGKKKKSSDSSMSSSKLSSKLTSSTTASASSLMNLGGVAGKTGQPQQVTSHPFWWHSRLYSENPGQLGPGQFSLGPPPAHAPGPGDNHPRVHPMNSMMPYIPTDSSDSDYSHIYGRCRFLRVALESFRPNHYSSATGNDGSKNYPKPKTNQPSQASKAK